MCVVGHCSARVIFAGCHRAPLSSGRIISWFCITFLVLHCIFKFVSWMSFGRLRLKVNFDRLDKVFMFTYLYHIAHTSRHNWLINRMARGDSWIKYTHSQTEHKIETHRLSSCARLSILHPLFINFIWWWLISGNFSPWICVRHWLE